MDWIGLVGIIGSFHWLGNKYLPSWLLSSCNHHTLAVTLSLSLRFDSQRAGHGFLFISFSGTKTMDIIYIHIRVRECLLFGPTTLTTNSFSHLLGYLPIWISLFIFLCQCIQILLSLSLCIPRRATQLTPSNRLPQQQLLLQQGLPQRRRSEKLTGA